MINTKLNLLRKKKILFNNNSNVNDSNRILVNSMISNDREKSYKYLVRFFSMSKEININKFDLT